MICHLQRHSRVQVSFVWRKVCFGLNNKTQRTGTALGTTLMKYIFGQYVCVGNYRPAHPNLVSGIIVGIKGKRWKSVINYGWEVNINYSPDKHRKAFTETRHPFRSILLLTFLMFQLQQKESIRSRKDFKLNECRKAFRHRWDLCNKHNVLQL